MFPNVGTVKTYLDCLEASESKCNGTPLLAHLPFLLVGFHATTIDTVHHPYLFLCEAFCFPLSRQVHNRSALFSEAWSCKVDYNSASSCIVVLTPVGEVTVCEWSGYTLYLTCKARSALWSTSGFNEGLSDQVRVPALTLANSSFRVTTTDTSTWTNYSTITISNFQYVDHGAIVTCESRLQTGQQSVTLLVGKFESHLMDVYITVFCNHIHVVSTSLNALISIGIEHYYSASCRGPRPPWAHSRSGMQQQNASM